MRSIAEQLRGLADQLDGLAADAPPPTTPPNMVAVRPTGPLGTGKTRFYPDPALIMNYAGQPVQTVAGYANQIQENWGSTHFDYRSQGGLLLQLPDSIIKAVPSGPAGFPEIIDRLAYSGDWSTQDDLDRGAALAERDKQIGAVFSPR